MIGVAEYIDSRPEEERLLLQIIRSVIMDCSPDIEERISYGIPFFYYKGPLIYLNTLKTGEVDIGFHKGNLIGDHHLFVSEKRKQVRSIPVKDIDDTLIEEIQSLVFKAMQVNDLKKK